jgi:hypothetical protein
MKDFTHGTITHMKTTGILALTLFCIQAQAYVLELSPVKDNTIYETQADPLSNGAGDYLFAGKTGQNADYTLRRAILAFDVSGLPANALINSATLELTVSRQNMPGAIALYRATSDWGEGTSDAPGAEGGGAIASFGDATWINAFHGDENTSGIPWNNVGGDFAMSATYTFPYSGNGTLVIENPVMAEDVQSWVDNPGSNFGWFIRGNEVTDNAAVRFNSRENPVDPPKLIIDYSILETVQLNPVKDNTLYEHPLGDLSNGAGDRLFFGLIQNGAKRRGLLEFDVSSIPASARVLFSELTAVVTNVPPGSTNENGTAGLHLALAEWGEAGSNGSGQGAAAQTGDATWIHTFFDTENWATAGGDFVAQPSTTAAFTTTNGETLSFSGTMEMLADVTLWIQNPDENHGWVLLGDEVTMGNARAVSSRDAASNQPELTIQYIIPDVIFYDGIND